MSASDKNILDRIFNTGALAYYGYSSIYTNDTHEVYGFVFYDVENNVPVSMIISKYIDTNSTLTSDYIPGVTYSILPTDSQSTSYTDTEIHIFSTLISGVSYVGTFGLNSNGYESKLSTYETPMYPGIYYLKEYEAPM